jgi:hypothetical protein
MRVIDLTGHRFGRLTVLHRDPKSIGGQATWVCHCDCGNEPTVDGCVLRRGESTSCGCYRREWSSIQHSTHGRSKSRTYNIWLAMRSRCFKPYAVNFARYGGRGITVCERWSSSFQAFLDDMGECPPGLTLDRFPNNKGNYEPGNCRWATYLEQAANRDTARGARHGKSKLTADQVELIKAKVSSGGCCRAIAREYRVHYNTIYAIKYGIHWTNPTNTVVT